MTFGWHWHGAWVFWWLRIYSQCGFTGGKQVNVGGHQVRDEAGEGLILFGKVFFWK